MGNEVNTNLSFVGVLRAIKTIAANTYHALTDSFQVRLVQSLDLEGEPFQLATSAKQDTQEQKLDQLISNQTNGTQRFAFAGYQLAESHKTEANAVANVITFAGNINAVEIYHEAATRQTFTVNGLSIIVPAGGWARLVGGVPGATVTIPAGLSCIVGRLA